ncbi:MAG: S41 family peptidase [Prevotella sp.]|jgi:carboxyl-terminal processing protease|nr:S41 family peptidase [Prevotella sp.]MCI2079450.1 S41 family peptidase [Prevotella sp.]MCI2101290.1 S41 family peptidase [Prevotella sp.]
MRKWIITVLCLLSLQLAAQDKDHNFNVAKNLDVFNAIYKNLDLMYVDSLDANEVVGNGIKAMLGSLDPYTVYYPAEKVKDLKELYTGKFAGIGALIRYLPKLNYTVVDEPYKNMPAAEAGLKKGDMILSIDGESMKGKNTQYVSDHLRGDAGTSFLLKIKRPSTGKEMKMKVTRKMIQEPVIVYYGMWKDHIGYLNLHQFTENCAKDVRKAFIDLKNQGMKGFVLDLRNNGGGSEQEAVNIVNIFVPKGVTIVSNRGKLKRVNKDYKTTVEPVDTVMPMVVLVSGNTASSSEITSGSLQDLDRAVIMGTRTFGKGLVQMTLDLPYNGNLKLTTNKYYIPSGRCIQAINYNHANGGYVEHVPDSLTKVFHTAHGRVVRDGGGIKPDVEVQPDSMPNIAAYLEYVDSANVMMNYEVDYIAAHKTIAPPAEFELTDADYEEFKQRVLKSNFKYDRESEKCFKDLVKLAKFEGYYDDAKEEFARLEKKLNHNVAKDLDFHKPVIKQLLENDIITAYYYQEGATQNALRYDKQMKAAVDLLNKPEEYQKILAPVTKK